MASWEQSTIDYIKQYCVEPNKGTYSVNLGNFLMLLKKEVRKAVLEMRTEHFTMTYAEIDAQIRKVLQRRNIDTDFKNT